MAVGLAESGHARRTRRRLLRQTAMVGRRRIRGTGRIPHRPVHVDIRDMAEKSCCWGDLNSRIRKTRQKRAAAAAALNLFIILVSVRSDVRILTAVLVVRQAVTRIVIVALIADVRGTVPVALLVPDIGLVRAWRVVLILILHVVR